MNMRYLPCVSSRVFSVVVSPPSPGGSAATGSLAKDCHAVRNDPRTLFFKSMLIRVKLSFSSTKQRETEMSSYNSTAYFSTEK